MAITHLKMLLYIHIYETRERVNFAIRDICRHRVCLLFHVPTTSKQVSIQQASKQAKKEYIGELIESNPSIYHSPDEFINSRLLNPWVVEYYDVVKKWKKKYYARKKNVCRVNVIHYSWGYCFRLKAII